MSLELTSKQRAQLRSMCNTLPVILYIGKDGVTEAVAKQAWDALEARELIKCSVQRGAPVTAREACEPELEREQITVEDKIRELKKKQKTFLTNKEEKETTIKVYKEIGEIKKIDRKVVEKFIDKIIVNREGRVEIQWTFKEIFQSA